MKHKKRKSRFSLILMLCLLVISYSSFAQRNSEKIPSTKKSDIPDEMPYFQGGDSALLSFIQENSSYEVSYEPINGDKNSFTFCTFLVNEDGSLSEIQSFIGPNEEFKNLIVEIVKKMPNWSPAKKRGKAIAVRRVIVVAFGERLKKE